MLWVNDHIFMNKKLPVHMIGISDSDDEEMDIDFSDAPEKPASEPVSEYFERTKEYWVGKAKEYCASEQMTLTTKKLEKLASEMCQEAFDS